MNAHKLSCGLEEQPFSPCPTELTSIQREHIFCYTPFGGDTKDLLFVEGDGEGESWAYIFSVLHARRAKVLALQYEVGLWLNLLLIIYPRSNRTRCGLYQDHYFDECTLRGGHAL